MPAARVFVTPGTMTGWSVAQNFHATNRRASYVTVVIDEPNVSANIFCSWMFSDQTTLKYAIFRGEGLKFGSGSGMFYSSQVKNTDVGWWHLSGATSLPGDGQLCGAANQRFYGSLHLPSLTSVGKTCLKGNDKLNEIVFGDGDKNARVTSIGTEAFNGASGLTNIVLNAAANLTVGANAFAGASGIKTVTLLGPAISEEAFADGLHFARRLVGGGLFARRRARAGRLPGGGVRTVGQGVDLPSPQPVRSEGHAFHYPLG